MADPHIPLFALLPDNREPSIGELVLGDPFHQAGVIAFNGQLSPQPYSIALERFVDLQMQITSNFNPHVAWGTVEAMPRQAAHLSVSANRSILPLKWHLTHADLEAIERGRAGAPYLTFNIAVDGLAFVTPDNASEAELHRIKGDGQLRLSVTDWEDKVLSPLNYTLPPSWDRLMPDPERRSHPEWLDAEKRLDEARKALRRGEGRDALSAALDAFESILTKPFDSAQWEAKLKTVPEGVLPEQKRDAIAKALGGFCTYLNRVGHHRGRQVPAATTTQPPMPVDQWEAEHVVAAAHFLLAMALRIAAMAEASPASPPPATVTA